jgi:hypothetical protein
LSLTRLIGNPSGIPFSNFSYTIYGLASGGKSWSYIYDVHPEVFDLSEPEHTKEVYRLAIELIKDNPIQTVYGALFYWKSIFTDTLYHVFSYISSENWVIHPLIKWMLYILSIIGIYSCVKNINNHHNSLVVVAALGVFLSVPFVPPIDSFRMRPYATSIVIIGLLPAMGVAYLSKWRKNNSIVEEDSSQRFPDQVPIFSLLLIIMMSMGPLALQRFTSTKEMTFQPCPPQQPDIILTRFDKGTFVNIRKNTEEFPDWIPNLHAYIFQKYSHTMADQNFTKWIDELRPTQTLFIALDIISNSDVFIVVPTELLPRAEDYIQLCGKF